ncbi:MAG: 3-oxoacyl-ACP synthase [Bacteroidia bacterium]
MMLTLDFKKQLLQTCKKIITERMENANKAMQAAQEAANGEDKSSAGDKYETSRAMGHRDRDMYARQLVEAKNELQKLERISIGPVDFVKHGSLLLANETIYFISTGIGKMEINNKTIMAISKESPIAQAMLGKRLDEEFTFNKNQWKITILI